jgi:hypothetical protein
VRDAAIAATVTAIVDYTITPHRLTPIGGIEALDGYRLCCDGSRIRRIGILAAGSKARAASVVSDVV